VEERGWVYAGLGYGRGEECHCEEGGDASAGAPSDLGRVSRANGDVDQGRGRVVMWGKRVGLGSRVGSGGGLWW